MMSKLVELFGKCEASKTDERWDFLEELSESGEYDHLSVDEVVVMSEFYCLCSLDEDINDRLMRYIEYYALDLRFCDKVMNVLMDNIENSEWARSSLRRIMRTFNFDINAEAFNSIDKERLSSVIRDLDRLK